MHILYITIVLIMASNSFPGGGYSLDLVIIGDFQIVSDATVA